MRFINKVTFGTELRSKRNEVNVGARLGVRPLGGDTQVPPYKKQKLSIDRQMV